MALAESDSGSLAHVKKDPFGASSDGEYPEPIRGSEEEVVASQVSSYNSQRLVIDEREKSNENIDSFAPSQTHGKTKNKH